MSSRKLLQIAVAALATTTIGYFVLRQLSWHDLVQLGRAADARLLAVGFACYVVANVLRAWRFRALTGDQIPSLALLRTVVIQNFLNTFLPLRAGEVSYLLMVHRTGTVKPGANLASLLGARVLDLVAALLIPLVTLPLSQAWSSESRPFLWFSAIALAMIATLACGLWRADALAAWMTRRATSQRAWLNRGLLMAGDALSALSQLRQARLLGRVGALTVGCWTLIYLCGYASLRGVGVSVGFWDGLFAYSFPTIASMTPLYMLGGFGVFEGSIGFGLSLVRVPLRVAMAAGVLLHIAELVFVILPAPFGLAFRRKAPV
ncbi:MAG: lysylphosphatidylglycerol synthase transmembrane domain-containing protein [Myxococcales bacterium]